MSVKLVCGYSLLCSVCCFTSIANSQFNTCGRGSAGVSVVKNVLSLEDKVYSGRESENAKTYIYLLRSSGASHCGCTCTAGLRLSAVRVESEEEFGRFRIPKKENERCGVIWSAFVSFGEKKVEFDYYFGKNYSDSFFYDRDGEALLKDSKDFFHSEEGKEILCKQFRNSNSNELSIEKILQLALFRWRADNIKTLTEFFKRVSKVGWENRVRINEMKVRPKYDLCGKNGYNCATFSREALFYLLRQNIQESTVCQRRGRWVGATAGGFLVGVGLGCCTPLSPFAAFLLGCVGGYGGGNLVGGWSAGVNNRPESIANGILSAMNEWYKSADEGGKRKLEDSFKIIFRTESDICRRRNDENTRREGISYAQRSVTLADVGSNELKAKNMKNGGKATVFLDTDFAPSSDALALMSAVRRGRPAVVCDLLNRGTSPNIRGDSGMTALMLAAQKGYKDIVNILVKSGADLNARDDSGKTALMYATQQGHESVVGILLANKASPNIQDNDGKTALMYASRRGHENVVEILLANKASPNIQDDDGKTAKILAEQSGYSDTVNILRRTQQQSNNDVDADILMWAVQEGSINFVNNLLDKGVDPNIQNSLGETALMWAAKNGNMDIVRILTERGADLNIRDNRGRTALMWAVMNW